MTKLLYLVGDGMGDYPIPEYGNKTILQAANTPAMDSIAARGLTGLCRTVPYSWPPGSDVANMSLMGFDPVAYHTGRGPIEAAAQGLQLDKDDLVWRCNLVSVSQYDEKGAMLDYSAGHVDTETAHELVRMLREKIGTEPYELVPGVQYRHLLVQRGGALQPEAELEISPPHDILDQPIAADLERYAQSASLSLFLRAAAQQLAMPGNNTRANALWPWGQGRPLLLPNFLETFDRKGAVVSAVDLVKGLGRAAGMEVLDVPGATGLLDTNYEGKVEAALSFLEHGDFVFVHVEAPDECGHGGDPSQKREAVERFDARIVAPLLQAMPDEAFLVTCDHFTPCVERTHTPEPVPFALAWPGSTPNGAVSLDEAAAGDTGLSIEQGYQLLPWALERLSGTPLPDFNKD